MQKMTIKKLSAVLWPFLVVALLLSTVVDSKPKALSEEDNIEGDEMLCSKFSGRLDPASMSGPAFCWSECGGRCIDQALSPKARTTYHMQPTGKQKRCRMRNTQKEAFRDECQAVAGASDDLNMDYEDYLRRSMAVAAPPPPVYPGAGPPVYPGAGPPAYAGVSPHAPLPQGPPPGVGGYPAPGAHLPRGPPPVVRPDAVDAAHNAVRSELWIWLGAAILVLVVVVGLIVAGIAHKRSQRGRRVRRSY